jgi:hypothetical protein
LDSRGLEQPWEMDDENALLAFLEEAGPSIEMDDWNRLAKKVLASHLTLS